jgi:hypothetical protein
MDALLGGPADWVSPGDDGGRFDFQGSPPPAGGKKVSLADTDHIYGTGGDAAWVWKTFTRGHNPIYMDPLKWDKSLRVSEADIVGARRAMGQTRRLAERVDLASMVPAGELASTRFCLADAGREYLVYVPNGGAVTVDLSATKGDVSVDWVDARTGEVAAKGVVPGGAKRRFEPPSHGPAALHLKSLR